MTVEFVVGMLIIGYFIMVMMLTGILTIKLLEIALKLSEMGIQDMSDLEEDNAKIVIEQYRNMNGVKKIAFVFTYGANMWALILFGRKNI